MHAHNRNQFIDFFKSSYNSSELIHVKLMNKRIATDELKSVTFRKVNLKKGDFLNIVYRYKTKDITKNLKLQNAIPEIIRLIESNFKQAVLVDKNKEVHLSNAKKSTISIKEVQFEGNLNSAHNKQKNRLISESALYLKQLGITNESGLVKSQMHDKYRQINKFVEIIDGIVSDEDIKENFKIADMGCGKGYLSFALYDFLRQKYSKNIEFKGIESREQLVNNSNVISKTCGFNNLSFHQGLIESFKFDDLDMLIALHACDTATDDAIYKGIRSRASYIICSPCCHKQIRKEINPKPHLKVLIKNGILKERQSEIITDSIRALILESEGYQTKVMEFISTEHTSKNLLIIAIKNSKHNTGVRERKLKEIEDLKEAFGIKKHHLEILLSQE